MMLSGVFALLVFLANVKETGSPSEISCDWVCEIHVANVSDQHCIWKTVLSKTGQIKAIFPLHKRVRKDCAKFTSTKNSSSFIEVWILTQASTQPREFGFLSFAVFEFLENVLPFRYLFDGKYTEQEVDKISLEISCVLQRTSNESKRLSRANGLDILISPYFYIRELANFSQNRPFLSHIWTENFYAFSAGFTNPDEKSQTSTENRQYSLQGKRWLNIVGHLVWILFTFYSASFLMLFCTNISTVEIAETPVRPSIHPEGDTEPDTEPAGPTEQGRLEDELISLIATQRQLDNYYTSPKPEEQDHLDDERDAPLRRIANHSVDYVNQSLEDCDIVALPEQTPIHYSKLVTCNRRFSTDRMSLLLTEKPQTSESHSYARPDENKLSSKRSGILGSSFTTQKQPFVVNIPSPAALPESVVTEAAVSLMEKKEKPARTIGQLNHRAHGSTSNDTRADTIEHEAGQSGAHNRDKKNLKSVRVINVWKAPSSVGLRSLIANYLLSHWWGKLFFLLFSPLLPVILLDFLLLPPRLFSGLAPSLPSKLMTISVFHFIYEKSPGLLVFLFFYFIRCLCLSFHQSSGNRVPSFCFRKHLWCFILNCYITQLLFNNDTSGCDECKKNLSDCPNECEIPVIIKRNIEIQLEIPMKDWKDVFHHFFQKCCQQFFPRDENTTSSCSDRCCGLLKQLCRLVFYIILCILDFLLSSPIICVCYGRVWFTANWSANWYRGNKCHRWLQFICLFIEFLFICSSIIWAVYLSICCSVTLEMAFASFPLIFVKNPAETLIQWAIYLIVCHNLWSCYSSFTDKYHDLEKTVFNMCTENHASELEHYQKGDVINIPEDLLVSVRNKLMPLKDSVRELIIDLLWCAGIPLFILIVISCNIEPIEPTYKILSAIVTFSMVLYSWLRGNKKEPDDPVLKEYVKRHVATYFKKKLD